MSRLVALMISFALTGPVSAGSDRKSYTEAQVYYLDWQIMTRSQQSVDDIRQRYQIKTSVRSSPEVERFVECLHLDQLSEVEGSAQDVDVRMVVDLIGADGSSETYFADQFNLFSMGGRKKRPIDDEFRTMFRRTGIRFCG